MLIKSRSKRKGKVERSVFEIVSEDGVMRPKKIIDIVQQLCKILDNYSHEDLLHIKEYIHPKNIIIGEEDTVQLSELFIPPSEREAYIPPEQSRIIKNNLGTNVYELGMIMLFMATGHENKTDLDIIIEDRSLRALIARCIAFDPQARFQNTTELMAAIKEIRSSPKKVLSAFIAFACICLALCLAFSFYKKGKTQGSVVGESSRYVEGYAIGYEKGFSDAPGIGIESSIVDSQNGNFLGNLISEIGAIAAQGEDEVFFLLEGDIYRMNPYLEDIQILISGASTYGLNYYDGWLYYCTDEEVLRINPKTLKEEIFCDSHTGILYIIDEEFYLHDISDTGYLYMIDPETKTLTQLNDVITYHCLNIVDKRLYYIDIDKGNRIYCCDLDGGNLNLINGNYCESFCIAGDEIYACIFDAEKDPHTQLANSLVSMDLNGGNLEKLTSIPVHYPNVTSGGIFYVAGENKTLEWMSLDGRTQYSILSSCTGPFNIIGRWIFYQNEEDNGNLWRVRIDGTGNVKLVQ